MKSLDTLAEEAAAWSLQTFGPGRERSTALHLQRESVELIAAVDAGDWSKIAEECADVFLLLAALCRRCGVNLPAAVKAKFTHVQSREWAPEDADGVIEHVRRNVN